MAPNGAVSHEFEIQRSSNNNVILEVGLPVSEFQECPTEKWTSDLNSAWKVIPKDRILGK